MIDKALAILEACQSQKDFTDLARNLGALIAQSPEWTVRGPWTWRNADLIRQRATSRLLLEPSLARVLVFHPDGWIRQAALEALKLPVLTQADAFALALRLNDWVPEVRQAAEAAMVRCFPLSDPDILAPVVWELLLRASSWHRWDNGLQVFVRLVMAHPVVTQRLVHRIKQPGSSGAIRVFRTLCQEPPLDPFLPDIFRTADQPHLRAMALTILFRGQVVWPLGRTTKVWVDKSAGLYRDVPDMGHRSLSLAVDQAALLQAGLTDATLIVQKAALDCLVSQRQNPALADVLAEAMARFDPDSRPAIRSRIDFLRSRVGECQGG